MVGKDLYLLRIKTQLKYRLSLFGTEVDWTSWFIEKIRNRSWLNFLFYWKDRAKYVFSKNYLYQTAVSSNNSFRSHCLIAKTEFAGKTFRMLVVKINNKIYQNGNGFEKKTKPNWKNEPWHQKADTSQELEKLLSTFLTDLNKSITEFCFSSYFCLIKFWLSQSIAEQKNISLEEEKKFYNLAGKNFRKLNWFSFYRKDERRGKCHYIYWYFVIHCYILFWLSHSSAIRQILWKPIRIPALIKRANNRLYYDYNQPLRKILNKI